MPKGRDWLWALGICAALVLAFYYRPLWSARRFLQRESENGFLEAYEGHRWMSGAIIARDGRAGAVTDATAPPVLARRFEIEAEHITFNGRRAEFVVRHVIKLAGSTPGGEDRTRQVHVKLRRRGSGWAYEHFQARGSAALDLPMDDNPWARVR